MPVKVTGNGDWDVYNISRPFSIENEQVVAVRYEPPFDLEKGKLTDSSIVFGRWRPDKKEIELLKDCIKLSGEDPTVVELPDGTVLIGLVETKVKGKETLYRTAFYHLKSLREGRFKKLKDLAGRALGLTTSLKPKVVGPWGMKDIRLLPLDEERVLLFTRPQRKFGSVQARLGRVGAIVTTWSELFKDTEKRLLAERNGREHIGLVEKAPVFLNQVAQNHWIGVNDAVLLKNGLVGVLAHTARWGTRKTGDSKKRYYDAVCFVLDPKKLRVTELVLVLTRKDFPSDLSAKRSVGYPEDGLKNVIFPGGMKRQEDGTLSLFVGISDKHAGVAVVEDPFKKIEAVSPEDFDSRIAWKEDLELGVGFPLKEDRQ